MAYKINNTFGTQIVSLADGTLDTTTTDLALFGKGYAGFGEKLNENFVKVLENFNNTSAPTNKITGQLWYDQTNKQINVYTGAKWKPVGSTTNSVSSPTNAVQGDMWLDTSNTQLYVYSGSAWILVGPTTVAGSGVTQVITETPEDNAGVKQSILKLVANDAVVGVISNVAFTPSSTETLGAALITAGFSTVAQGIQLSSAVASVKFRGTATDSDALGGVAAANYLRSNANDTTTGTLGIVTDSGMTVGTDSDISVTVDATGGIIANTIQDTDITFKVNDGGVTTTVMTIDGSESRVGIGTTTPTTKLDVNGTITATSLVASVTGNITGNLTGTASGNLPLAGGTMTGTLTSLNILPAADASYNIGSSLLGYNTVYAKATSAQYADLAEKYETDSEYEVGTVVIFGGEKEVTQSTISNDTRVAGVISEEPAYLMNDKSDGQAIALVGKVKCKVHGIIKKGDLLTTSGEQPGYAKKAISPVLGSIVGKAMENNDTAEKSVILISVGRL